jgi:signal transduction histidine kinase
MDESFSDSLKQKVEELMREKQHVLSIVSHDLRSPLNRIFALIQLVQMSADNLTAEQTDFLEKMHLIVADGLAMMRNLVDYRNLEYRTIDLHPESINVGDVITSATKSFKAIAAKKNLNIECSCENNLIVTTDKQCLGRVIDNLLANALKFSSPGKKIHVRATQSANRISVEVQDDAGGFLESERNQIFQKFQKLSARPTAGESSTGLGLFVAQSMAEKIGSKITCSTTERVGSVFSFELSKV